MEFKINFQFALIKSLFSTENVHEDPMEKSYQILAIDWLLRSMYIKQLPHFADSTLSFKTHYRICSQWKRFNSRILHCFIFNTRLLWPPILKMLVIAIFYCQNLMWRKVINKYFIEKFSVKLLL